MKWKISWWAFFIWMFCANVASASIRINEIAWMGTASSTTGEWIELASDTGSIVSLYGWHIDAVDGSPKITLSGAIGAQGYFLIERNSDTTVPNISADLTTTFGPGLSNAGETLELKDANGAIVDTVVGGKNWTNIGGDNSTKQTAQRTEDGSVWVTGVPTPRATNIRPSITVTATNTLNPHTASSKADARGAETTPSQNATGEVLWKHEGGDLSGGILLGRNTELLLVFISVMLSVLAGIIIVRSGKKEEQPPADDYAIIEDIIEGANDD